jgi:hypothetical protein
MTVGKCFRTNNRIRNKLIEKFAASRKGRIYFFEQFVDTNYLFNNYARRIQAYLKHENGAEPILFGHSILFLAGFLKLDVSACRKQIEVIKTIQPDKSIYPWPLGRYVSSQILYSYFIEGHLPANLWSFIEKVTKIAYSYPGYLKKGLIEYELYIMVSLVLVQQFELLEKLLTNIFRNYFNNKYEDSSDSFLRQNQNALPHLFMKYTKYKLGKQTDSRFEPTLSQAIENYITTFDDYLYLLLLNWFMFDYLSDKGRTKEAGHYFESALNLSKIAGYDFFTAFLLHNHPGNNKDITLFSTQMIENSGFNLSLFNYPIGPSVSQQNP